MDDLKSKAKVTAVEWTLPVVKGNYHIRFNVDDGTGVEHSAGQTRTFSIVDAGYGFSETVRK